MRLSHKQIMVLALSCIAATGVLGFSMIGGKWSGTRTTFHVNIPGAAPNGTSWSSAFTNAMAQWSNQTPFKFDVDTTYIDPCAGYFRGTRGRGFPSGSGDAKNSAGFGSTVCGNDFGSNVLAIT